MPFEMGRNENFVLCYRAKRYCRGAEAMQCTNSPVTTAHSLASMPLPMACLCPNFTCYVDGCRC